MTSPLFKSSPQPAVQPTAQPDKPKPGPQARSTVYAIRPYVGGAAKAKSGKTIKLSSNEAAFGPSPQAIAAGKAAAASLHRYPDGNAAALRNALQARYHYPAEQIVCGAGSDEIISLLCQAYLEPGDETLYSAHGFLMYRLSTLAAGGTPVAVPERDLRVQVDAILDALSPRTKLVFVANPNNPTGSYLTKSELLRLHEALPDSVLLCIDEAYGEYRKLRYRRARLWRCWISGGARSPQSGGHRYLFKALWAWRTAGRLGLCSARNYRRA